MTQHPIVSPQQADVPANIVIDDAGLFVPTQIARIPQLAVMYPALSEPQIRSWVFAATWATDGPFSILRNAVIRIGRVVLIDVKLFDEWLRKYRGHVDLATRGKLGGRPAKITKPAKKSTKELARYAR